MKNKSTTCCVLQEICSRIRKSFWNSLPHISKKTSLHLPDIQKNSIKIQIIYLKNVFLHLKTQHFKPISWIIFKRINTFNYTSYTDTSKHHDYWTHLYSLTFFLFTFTGKCTHLYLYKPLLSQGGKLFPFPSQWRPKIRFKMPNFKAFSEK